MSHFLATSFVFFLVVTLLISTSAFVLSIPSSPALRSSPPATRIFSTSPSTSSSQSPSLERTYIMIKPDGVQRGLVGSIITRFERKGYKLVAMKFQKASGEMLEEHYKELVDKPFFPKMKHHMMSGPVCCMVWSGRSAVETGRVMLGATDPLSSLPGTIRGDYCLEVGKNVCHGSDSVENAEKEIKLWFNEGEIVEWKSCEEGWVYE